MAKGRVPWKTQRIPREFDGVLPRLIDLAVADDSDQLRELMTDPKLFSRSNVVYLLSMSVALAVGFSTTALGELPISDDQREQFLTNMVTASAPLPVHPSEEEMRRWLVHVTGGPASVWYSRPSEFDLNGLCCAIAICAAASTHRGWTSANIRRLYEQTRDHVEHASRILKP
jgi:hypothetical protein